MADDNDVVLALATTIIVMAAARMHRWHKRSCWVHDRMLCRQLYGTYWSSGNRYLTHWSENLSKFLPNGYCWIRYHDNIKQLSPDQHQNTKETSRFIILQGYKAKKQHDRSEFLVHNPIFILSHNILSSCEKLATMTANAARTNMPARPTTVPR